MTYCTADELSNLTGSSLSILILQEIIDQADREIKGRLLMMNVSVPSSDDTLKAASLDLAKIGVLTHPDSDQVSSSIKLGDIEIKRADVGKVCGDLSKQAWQSVDDYVLRHGQNGASRFYIRKVEGK